MLTDIQIAERLDYITGSDAAVICGLSPYKTPYQLWCEKTRRTIQDDISHKNHIKFGNYFEQGVADWFCADSGKTIKPKTDKMIVHPTIPYLAGNVDFEIDGENAILECKTSLNDEGWGNGDNFIPAYYLTQVAHYCAVGNYSKAYIAVVFAAKREMRWYVYDRNLELEAKLLAREKNFWENFVKADIAPEASNRDDIMLIYKETKEEPIIADNTIEEKLQLLKTTEKQLKLLDAQKETLKKALALYMKDHDTLLDSSGTPLATWKFTKAVNRFDAKLFEQENKELYAKYIREGARYRRFLIKGTKDE